MSELRVTTLQHEAAAASNITLAANGHVGIGTGSPSAKLEVAGSGNFAQMLRLTDTSVAGRITDIAYTSTGPYIAVANSEPLAIYTSGTERMRIDSAGRVTMPYQPHARVSRNTGAILGGNVIVFNNANENTAGIYNAANGRFTAPVTGRYLFSHGMFSETGYSAWLFWRVNGTEIASTYQNAPNYDSVAASIVLSMNANDYADLYVNNNAAYRIYGGAYSQCWATFTLLS
tara:strand:+ start:1379 stop:2071 length:693 start_codon:yes stop_codon:yes gene_type:complete